MGTPFRGEILGGRAVYGLPHFSKTGPFFHHFRDGTRGACCLAAWPPWRFWHPRCAMAHLVWSQHMLRASAKLVAVRMMMRMGRRCSTVGPVLCVRGACMLMGLPHSAQWMGLSWLAAMYARARSVYLRWLRGSRMGHPDSVIG